MIVKVQGEAVHDTGDFTHVLRSKTETVSVGIIRDKKEQTISLTLPPRKGADLMEESFEEPTLDADTRMEISEVQSEMAKLKPQMELAAREMKQVQEQAKDECKRQQVEIKKHVQQLHRNLRNQRNEIQHEFRWNSVRRRYLAIKARRAPLCRRRQEHPVPSGYLGRVEAGVRGFHNLISRSPMIGKCRGPSADRYRTRYARKLPGLHQTAQLLCHCQGMLRIGLGEQNCELLSTVAADHVNLP